MRSTRINDSRASVKKGRDFIPDFIPEPAGPPSPNAEQEQSKP